MRVNEPSASFSQLLPSLPETLGDNSGPARLEPLLHPSGPAIPAKAEVLDASPVASLASDREEELSSLPILQDNASTQNQCQVSEATLISPPKEVTISDPSSPPAEDRVFAWALTLAAFHLTFSADAQAESPAEKSAEIIADENYEEAIDFRGPEYYREWNSRSQEDFTPLEEVSLDLSAWEETGSQWTARNINRRRSSLPLSLPSSTKKWKRP